MPITYIVLLYDMYIQYIYTHCILVLTIICFEASWPSTTAAQENQLSLIPPRDKEMVSFGKTLILD